MDTRDCFDQPDSVAFALDMLRRRFPRVCLWFGTSTKHWWALANGRLIEARTPQELGVLVDLGIAERPYTKPAVGRQSHLIVGTPVRPSAGGRPRFHSVLRSDGEPDAGVSNR